MNPTRRSLLLTTALLPVAGCVALKNMLGTTPAQWASDLSMAAGWVPTITAALAALGTASAGTIAQINALGVAVQKDAAAVATATANVVAGTSAAGYVQEAISALTAICNVVLPLFPATSALVPIVDAILAIMPELAAAVGLTSAPLAVTPHAVYTLPMARALLAVPH